MGSLLDAESDRRMLVSRSNALGLDVNWSSRNPSKEEVNRSAALKDAQSWLSLADGWKGRLAKAA